MVQGSFQEWKSFFISIIKKTYTGFSVKTAHQNLDSDIVNQGVVYKEINQKITVPKNSLYLLCSQVWLCCFLCKGCRENTAKKKCHKSDLYILVTLKILWPTKVFFNRQKYILSYEKLWVHENFSSSIFNPNFLSCSMINWFIINWHTIRAVF